MNGSFATEPHCTVGCIGGTSNSCGEDVADEWSNLGEQGSLAEDLGRQVWHGVAWRGVSCRGVARFRSQEGLLTSNSALRVVLRHQAAHAHLFASQLHNINSKNNKPTLTYAHKAKQAKKHTATNRVITSA